MGFPATDVTRRARATYMTYAVRSAWRSVKERRFMSGLAQLREAAKLWGLAAPAPDTAADPQVLR
jgi:hypothetical protein